MTPQRFDHLLAMTDHIGTFEHADHATPRREHGYCTDDVARVLVAVSREPHPDAAAVELARVAFRFLTAAQGVSGTVRNRRDVRGRWHGRRGVEDCWGRTVWAYGTAAARAPEGWMREAALAHFGHAVQQRSPWPRAMAFAALGADEVLDVEPAHLLARKLLADAVDVIGRPAADAGWPWPEPRLTYANAALADALLAAGSRLDRHAVVDDGLRMLGWLLERETVDGHLSPTPVGGADREGAAPAFDQQPIEVAAMADACARALAVTGDERWLRGVALAVAWFEGDNDAASAMWDEATGGGFDGLHATGPNRNQGAESTLAFIVTAQRRVQLAAA